MAKPMTEICNGYRQLAQDFADHLHEIAPAHAAGEIKAETLDVAADQVIVVYLPPEAPVHLISDIARFIDAQREAHGIAVPVIVTPASAVAVQDREA